MLNNPLFLAQWAGKQGKTTARCVLDFFLIITTTLLSFHAQAKPEYVVGLTEQGIRIAAIEEVELGFNYQLEQLTKDKDYSMRIKVFPDTEKLTELLVTHKLQGYFGSPALFIYHRALFDINYLYAPIINNKVLHRYVVLVRKDSGIKQLVDLKQKTLAYCGADEIGMLFLQHELKGGKLGLIDRFFKNTLLKKNPNLATSAVFFKEADATLVLESDFLVASELNPQLNKQLVVIETSPEYITNLLALNHQDGFVLNADLDSLVLRLGNAIHSKSLMKSYKYGTIQKIKLEDLSSVESLIASTNKEDLNKDVMTKESMTKVTFSKETLPKETLNAKGKSK